MALNNTIFLILEENAIEGNSKLQPLADAVRDRNLITFYYTGPTKGKNKVKQGDRVKAEGVAIGLTKKGNLALRAYVPSPNISKKGFNETHWRTFLIDRMKRLAVLRETFNTKREDYQTGDDGSFTVTYVKSDWDKEAVIIPPKEEKPTKIPKSRTDLKKPTTQVEPEPQSEPTPQVEPKIQPEPISQAKLEKKPEELPQPKPKTKPAPIEKTNVQPKQKVEPEKIVAKPEVLPQPKPDVKPSVNPEDEKNKNLQESILKIKRLMFS